MTQLRHSGARVVVQPDTVVKTQACTAAAVECERTRMGLQVAALCGGFVVPDILEHDAAAGRIVFARLHGLTRLDGTGPHGGAPEHAFATAGRALGHIHGSFAAPGCCDAFAHGDFGLDNVLWSQSRQSLVVLDWADAAWATPRCIKHRRSRSVDLGIFLVGVFYRSRLRMLRRNAAAEAAAEFLGGYRDGGGQVDRDALLDCTARLAAAKQSGRRTWVGRLLHAPAVHDLRRQILVLT